MFFLLLGDVGHELLLLGFLCGAIFGKGLIIVTEVWFNFAIQCIGLHNDNSIVLMVVADNLHLNCNFI